MLQSLSTKPASYSSAPEAPARIDTFATFYPYSYFDKQGTFHAGGASAKRNWIILIILNTIIVVAAIAIAIIIAIFIGTSGYPVIACVFAGLMLLGAYIQVRAFDYRRKYGVWCGVCAHCRNPLNVAARKIESQTTPCPTCRGRVLFKAGSFTPVPWYTP
jgi:DNA-directed RNA polymerase subunit RPC12/RpoP